MDYNSIAQLVGGLSYYLTLPLLYVIRYYFYKNFLGFKKKTLTYISASVFLVLFNFSTDTVIPNILGIILSNFLLLLTIHFLCNGNVVIKLYAIIVESTILLLVNLIYLPFDFWVSPFINSIDMTFNQHMFVNFTHNAILDILSYIILYIVLKKVSYYLSFKNKSLNLSQSLYLLIPCLSSYGLALIFYLIQKVKIDDRVYYLPSISPKIYYMLLPFISFSLLISLPIMASTFKNQIESELQQQKTILIEQQFALQLNHMKNIDGIYLGRRKKLF